MTMTQSSELHLLSSSTCLLSAFAESFTQKHPHTAWRKHVVILPTQRLITAFHALLSEKVSAYFPPRCFTPETYLRVGPFAESTSAKIIDEYSLSLLMHDVRESKKFKTIFSNQLNEARVLLREMIEDDVDVRDIVKLTERVTSSAHTAEHGHFLHERFSETATWLQETLSRLQQSSQLLSEQAEKQHIAALIQRIELDPSRVANTHFVGLTSLNASWNRLLIVLAKTPCKFWLSHFGEHESARNYPVTIMRQMIAPHAIITDHLADDRAIKSHPAIQVFPSAYEEVHSTWSQAQSLASAQQATAILLADEAGYSPLISAMTHEGQLDINDALARVPEQNSFHNWLQCFLALGVSHNLSAEQALSLASHPISKQLTQIDSKPSSLSSHIQHCRDRDLNYFVPHRHTSSELTPLLLMLDSLVPLWRKAAASSCDAVALWLQQSVRTYGQQLPSKLIDESAQIVAAVSRIQDQRSVSFVARCDTIRSMLQDMTKRNIGEPLNHLQILNLSEARFFPFQNVFLLGCMDDYLPQRPPQDTLIDDFTKRSLGLAGWSRVEQMQLQNFELLRARLPGLRMSFSQTIAGEERYGATVLEQLVATGHTSFVHQARILQTEDVSGRDRLQQMSLASKNYDQFFAQLSASSLQSLLECPFRFALNKLDVRSFDFEDREQDLALEGEWMHEILCAFFRNNQIAEEPLWPAERISLDQFKVIGLAKISFLTDHFAPKSTATVPVVMHLKHFSWPKFVEHIAQNLPATASQPTAQVRKEFAIRQQGMEPIVNLSGKSVCVSGRIDSIDVESDFALITDYKRNASASRADTAKGFSVQLPFYMEALRTHVSKPLVSGYWSILAGKFIEGSCDDDNTNCPTELSNKKPTSQSLAWKSAQSHTSWRLEQIKETAGFTPDPSSCDFCEFAGICRKDDLAHDRSTTLNEMWSERRRDFVNTPS
jgi:hypothetical protein